MLRYLLPLFIVSSTYAQSVDVRIDDVEGIMREVVSLDTLSAQSIHEGVVRWVKRNYNNPSEVLMVDEPELVRVRERVALSVSVAGLVCYATTDWDIKDNKVRLTIGQYDCESGGGKFNALKGMRNKSGGVKFGYSAHHDWVVSSFNSKVAGVKSILTDDKSPKDDW